MGSRPARHRYCRCGTHLATDNTGQQCARCARASRDKLIAPPEVPAEFWQTEQLRDAFTAQHMGRVARAYRTHPSHHAVYGTDGISQTLLGQWLGIGQPQISRTESGAPIRNLDTLAYWARTLHIPAELLWFDLPGQTRQVAQPGRDDSLSQLSAGSGELELATLLSGLTASRLPLIDHQPDSLSIGISALQDMSLAESADLLLKLFLQLDNELGGDMLYVPLSRYLARLAVNVEKDPATSLYAFGQLSQMAGWLALDGNRHAAAQRYFTTAIYVAHEASEPALAASALAYMSLQETYRGRLKPALSLAQTAFTVGNSSLTPLTKTMLGTRLARAHAGVHNTKACLQTLDDTHSAFSAAGSSEEPLWISYVDTVEVAAQEGACYLDLGMASEAQVTLKRAIRLLEEQAPHRVRDQVHYQSRLAKSYLLDREVEHACAAATEAVALSAAIGSARVAERLTEFYDAVESFGDNQAAREFRELFVAIARPDS